MLEYKHLLFRRQYIISNIEIECPSGFSTIMLPHKYTLFFHNDLIKTEISYNEKKLVLLGDIYDSCHPEYSNTDILNELIQLNYNILLEKTTKLAGKFVLVYSDQDGIKISNDAVACRKVFYTVNNSTASCSSNPYLLADLLGFKDSEDQSLHDYYNSKEFYANQFANVGEYTIYDEVKQLLPNHFLNATSLKTRRYWPNGELAFHSNKQCVSECAAMIKGFILAAAKRYSLMIPITSGYDSRVILAASKSIKNNVFYYLNEMEHIKTSPDGWVPKEMLSSLKLDFHLLKIDKADEEFKKIYSQNNRFANPNYPDIMFNYMAHFSNRLNLPGEVIPIVKSEYGHISSKKVTGLQLARIRKLNKFQFVIDHFTNWLENVGDLPKRAGINLFELLYWEDRLGNKAVQTQLDKDIAQEDFIVFNSAYLLSLMLLYDRKKRRPPHYKLHLDLIKNMWPELLDYPINPSKRNRIIKIFDFLGLYYPYRKVRKMIQNKSLS